MQRNRCPSHCLLPAVGVRRKDPMVDGSPDGLLANHRRNLDAYIAEARQKMYSIREELEK